MSPKILPNRKDKNIVLPYLTRRHHIPVFYTIQICHDKTEKANNDVVSFQDKQRKRRKGQLLSNSEYRYRTTNIPKLQQSHS